MIKEHCQKLESMYLRANVNTKIYDTTECRIDEGTSEIKLTVADKYFHALAASSKSLKYTEPCIAPSA